MAVVIDITERSLKDPMSPTARSKGLKMPMHLNTPIKGSTPARSMYLCPRFMCVCCVLYCPEQSASSMVISPC